MAKNKIPTNDTSLTYENHSTSPTTTNNSSPSPSTPEPKPQPQLPPKTSPPPPPLPVTDLVHDLSPKTTSSLPTCFSSIHTSKHAPDFRVRNQAKILRLSDILSNLSLHLAIAKKERNQATFDGLYARIAKAGEGLESLEAEIEGRESGERENMVVRDGKGDGYSEGKEETWGYWVNEQEEAGWYAVRHELAREEGREYEGSSRERIASAREEYEAGLERRAADESGNGFVTGSDEGGEDGRQQGEKFGSQETTLVEGLEGEELHLALSVGLDGG